MGAVDFGLSSPRKASWICYNWCFDYNCKIISTRITDKSCLLRDNHSNNSDNNRLSFDTLKNRWL